MTYDPLATTKTYRSTKVRRFLRALRFVFLVAVLAGIIALLCLALGGCAIPVRPIGYVDPDPMTPGSYRFAPDPEREPQPASAVGSIAGLVGAALPGPWGAIVSALGASLVAGRIAKRGPQRCLEQTVAGIEQAKAKLPPEALDALHTALAMAQDDSTKRAVWEARP